MRLPCLAFFLPCRATMRESFCYPRAGTRQNLTVLTPCPWSPIRDRHALFKPLVCDSVYSSPGQVMQDCGHRSALPLAHTVLFQRRELEAVSQQPETAGRRACPSSEMRLLCLTFSTKGRSVSCFLQSLLWIPGASLS